ncbi:MAG: SlyX family protein [Sphaerochaetaceae bacterium]|nr:SlyX family protein [Sphaerochaetaceae bacterium]
MQHLEKIETDIVYLQDKMQQLNDIVAQLQSSVTKLEKQNEFLARKVQEMDVEARPDRRPPHY